MGNKRFKDPIYGYVEIEEKLVAQIVDTAVFQRLRDVIQTSYAPLYSSAMHNRFVHSIGVYHLGKMAAESFHKSISDKSLQIFQDINQYIKVFELACLLHDIGHAPFSHTGEFFYLYNGERTILHEKIIELTKDTELLKEINDNSYKAAPHELMSVIVALRAFSDLIPDVMKAFFARCITGYKYTHNMDADKSCMNCLIELLNSEIIDVDKIDYLIRDSYVTGFDTVSIDYDRLLRSIYVDENMGNYQICFDKAAVSVLENVVYAHDAERKWIQNHPIVLYEAYIIENAMQQVVEQIFKAENLSEEFLSVEGVTVKKFGKVRLIGDSDIMYLMKNLDDNDFFTEYYDRRCRKHPLWKTEAEFQAIFREEEGNLAIIEKEFMELKKHLNSLGLPFVINKAALTASDKEIQRIKRKMKDTTGEELERFQATLAANNVHIKWLKVFEKFAKKNKDKLDFDFLIIFTNQFNSGFRKREFSNIEIIFPELKRPCKFKEVSNILTSEKSKGENFFFIYYNRKISGVSPSITDLIYDMFSLSTNMLVEDRFK